MIPSVAAISQQYAQFAPRARCRCCRWPRVCVWSRSINAGSASARIQWTCKMCSNNIPISLAISSHLSVNNIINTITSVLSKYAANITQPHTGSKTSFNPKTKFQRCDKNENVSIDLSPPKFWPCCILREIWMWWHSLQCADCGCEADESSGGKGQGRTIITRDTGHVTSWPTRQMQSPACTRQCFGSVKMRSNS